MALTAAIALMTRRSEAWQVIALCVLLFGSLFYWLSGWITKTGLGVAERIGRAAVLLVVIATTVILYGWHFRPGWHLTGEQEDGLAEVAHNVPKNITVLVELPENSTAGQHYGRDIMRVLRDNGVRVNAITVFQGGGETPVGLLVSARYHSDPAFQVAGYMHSRMLFLGIPSRFQEGNAVADATSFIIYVGSKPVE